MMRLDSTTTCATTARGRMPIARSMPISRPRSMTAVTSVLTSPNTSAPMMTRK